MRSFFTDIIEIFISGNLKYCIFSIIINNRRLKNIYIFENQGSVKLCDLIDTHYIVK